MICRMGKTFLLGFSFLIVTVYAFVMWLPIIEKKVPHLYYNIFYTVSLKLPFIRNEIFVISYLA